MSGLVRAGRLDSTFVQQGSLVDEAAGSLTADLGQRDTPATRGKSAVDCGIDIRPFVEQGKAHAVLGAGATRWVLVVIVPTCACGVPNSSRYLG